MKLIIGLGNPGIEYAGTRHNFGFEALNRFANDVGAKWQNKSKFQAQIAEFTHDGEKVLLAKPQTYYNLVGQSARALRDFYHLTNGDILVIHDEMDLPIGTIRTRISGSDAGNNGVRNLIEHLGKDFARIRIGSDNERATGDRVGHVLSRPATDEKEKLQTLESEIQNQIERFIVGDFAGTTHKVK